MSRAERFCDDAQQSRWGPGTAPLAVIMISLNEAHNMAPVLETLKGWAQEVLLVDSLSRDDTVEIALRYGVQIMQCPFRGFGNQWSFALRELPIRAPYTMKIDPDERLSAALKNSHETAIAFDRYDAFYVTRRLWFMGRALHVRHQMLRAWRTGTCHFSDVTVHEHPIVNGRNIAVAGDLEHHDSPTLGHWIDKQDRYLTAEVAAAFQRDSLSARPRLFGTSLERRMWLKRVYWHLPLRFLAMFWYCLFVRGAWREGRVGVIWVRLRAEVYRMIEYKRIEMSFLGRAYDLWPTP